MKWHHIHGFHLPELRTESQSTWNRKKKGGDHKNVYTNAVTYNAGTACGVGLGGSRYTQISISTPPSKFHLERYRYWYTSTITWQHLNAICIITVNPLVMYNTWMMLITLHMVKPFTLVERPWHSYSSTTVRSSAQPFNRNWIKIKNTAYKQWYKVNTLSDLWEKNLQSHSGQYITIEAWVMNKK
jgi:hypothetical protein